MAITEDLIVKLGLQIDDNGRLRDARGKFVKLEDAMKGTEAQSVVLKKRFQGLAVEITGLNSVLELGKKAMNGIGAAVDSVIDPFVEFENALVGVKKTADLSDEAGARFGDRMQELSEQIPVASAELLDLAAAAGQLGVKGEENLANFAETIAKVGVATDLAGEEGAKALVRILNATKEPIDKVDEFASVIVKLGNSVAASESEIARMTTEIARSIGVFGASSAEAAGIGAAMKEVGIQAALGGSVVGKSMRVIESALRNGGSEMSVLTKLTGMTGEQLKETFEKDATGVFTSFVEGLGKVNKEGGSVAAALESMGLSGDEVNKVLPVLATNADKLRGRIALATGEMENATALNLEAANAFKTLESAMKITQNVIQNVAADIGGSLKPAAIALLSTVRDLFVFLRELGSAFSEVMEGLSGLPIVQRMTGALMDLGKVISDLTTMIGTGILGALNEFNKQIQTNQDFIDKLLIVLAGLGAVLAGAVTLGLISAGKAMVAYGIATLKATLKSVVLVAKLAALGIAVIAVAGAVDILVRNFDNLGNVGSTIGAAFKIIGVFGLQMLAKLNTKFQEFIVNIVTSLNKFGVVSEAVVIGALRNVQLAMKEESKLVDVRLKAGEALSKSAKAVDFGIIGKGVKLFEKGLGGTSLKAKELAEDVKKVGDVAKESIESSSGAVGSIEKMGKKAKETKDELQGILDKNEDLRLSIMNIGEDAVGALQNQLDFDLKALANKEKQLTATKAITPEIRKAIKAQKELLQIQTGLKIAEIQLKQAKEQVKITKDLRSENKKIAMDLVNQGASEKERINNNLRLDLERLKAKEDQLKAEKPITKEMERQFEIRAKLLRIKAKRDIAAAERSAGEVQLFDPKQLDKIGAAFGSGAQEVAGAASQMFAGPLAAIGAANAILDAGQKLVDAIPGLLNKAANLINSITDLPQAILEGVQNLVGSLVRTAAELLPNLARGLVDILDELVTGLLIGLPDAFLAMMRDLPDLLIDLLENRLPDIVTRFVEGFITSTPKIVLAFIEFMVKGQPRIAKALLKVIVLELPKAIVKGVIAAFKGLSTGFASELADDVAKVFNNGVKALTEKATDVGAQVFKVLDLEAAGRGFKRAKDAEKLIKQAQEKLNFLFLQFLQLLRDLWRWINEKILMPITKAWRRLWNFVKEMFDFVIGAFEAMWDFVKAMFDTVLVAFDFLWKFVQSIFDKFQTAMEVFTSSIRQIFEDAKVIFDDAVAGLKEAFEKLKTEGEAFAEKIGGVFDDAGSTIADGFKDRMDDLVDSLKSFGRDIANGWRDRMEGLPNTIASYGKDIANGWRDRMEGLPNTIASYGKDIANGWRDRMDSLPNTIAGFGADIANGFRDRFNDLVNSMGSALASAFSGNISLPGGGGGGGGGLLGGLIHKGGLVADAPMVRFARGGRVPGSAMVPGDSIRNDIVPALLSPNEVVIPRSVTRDRAMMTLALALASGKMQNFQTGGFVSSTPSRSLNIGSQIGSSRSSGSKTVNQDISVSMQVDLSAQNIDSSFVREQLIPTVKEALREASNRGELLINEKAIFE